MNRENTVWLIVCVLGALMLIGRAVLTEKGMAKSYVQQVSVDRVSVDDPDAEDPTAKKWISAEEARDNGITLPAEGSPQRVTWTRYDNTNYTDYALAVAAGQTDYQFSLSRTIGVWLAALFTLFVLSFLIKDNPFYKISESVFVGVSAAYWMVVGFWGTIVPNLLAKISPDMIRAWSMPGLGANERVEWVYLAPLVLGLMLLWRLSPKGGWISRWPMAFFIGTFCGLRLIGFLQANFLNQIRNSIQPLIMTGADGIDVLWDSLRNIILIVGVLSGIVYFFFSIEHKGIVGKTAKLGIWFLMVTFGAAFGYTVMGRVALLAIRLEFLFDDWLWLIDPTDKRIGI